MLLLLVSLLQLNSATFQRLMFDHEVLSFRRHVLIDIATLVAHLHIRLGLLEHSQFEAPDLVFNIPVVFLELPILDNLSHQLLKLIILDLLIILLVS